MGHEHSKLQKNSTKLDKSPSNPNNIGLIIREIFYTSQLKKGHKRASQNLKEKELMVFMNQSSTDIIEQFDKASAILYLSREIQALDLVMCYCDVLTDNLPTLNSSQGDAEKMKELLPYIGSLLFACEKLGIEVGIALAETLSVQFPKQNFTEKTTPDILTCFESTFPSEQQISQYLLHFSKPQNQTHDRNQTPIPTQSQSQNQAPKSPKSDSGNKNGSQSSSRIQQQPYLPPLHDRVSHTQTPRHDGDRQWTPELEESEYGKMSQMSQMTASFPHQSESDRFLSESRLYQASRQIQSSEIREPDVAMSFGGPKIQRQIVNQKKDDTMDTEDKNSPREHASPTGSPINNSLTVSQSMKINKYPNLANWSVRGLEMAGGQESQVMSQQLIHRLNSVRQNL